MCRVKGNGSAFACAMVMVTCVLIHLHENTIKMRSALESTFGGGCVLLIGKLIGKLISKTNKNSINQEFTVAI